MKALLFKQVIHNTQPKEGDVRKFKRFLRRLGNSDLKKAQAAAHDVNNGIRTRNEVRRSLGLPPITEPLADKLTITTPTGIVEL